MKRAADCLADDGARSVATHHPERAQRLVGTRVDGAAHAYLYPVAVGHDADRFEAVAYLDTAEPIEPAPQRTLQIGLMKQIVGCPALRPLLSCGLSLKHQKPLGVHILHAGGGAQMGFQSGREPHVLEHAHDLAVEMYRARQVQQTWLAIDDDRVQPQAPNRFASEAPVGPRPMMSTS